MKTALITGANSGLGLETARQLGLDPTYGKIFLGVRSQAKGDAAKTTLTERHGCPDTFEVLVMDVSSIESTRSALSALSEQHPRLRLDAVVLNAGQVGPPRLKRSPDGIEIAYAASLIGHHIMTVFMLQNDMLNTDATLVIAGAEAARGTLPGMALYDVRGLASTQFNGVLVDTMMAMARGDVPTPYHARNNLATLKAFSQWWGAAMARRLKEQRVPAKLFIVSPGGVPSTNGINNLPFATRTFFRAMAPVLKLFGQVHSIQTGAARYVEVLNRPASDSGKFFASPDSKNVGPLVDNTPFYKHFQDEALQDAALATLEQLTGVAFESHTDGWHEHKSSPVALAR